MGKIIKDGVVYGGSTGGATDAKELNYDNSIAGLKSNNVQDAIDEIYDKNLEDIGIEMTKEQYDALSEEEKMSGTYWITDLDNNIGGGSTGTTVEVIDNLESTDPEAALSANMGRQLKEEMTGIDISNLVTVCGANGEIKYAKKYGNRVVISFINCSQTQGNYGFLVTFNDDSLYPQSDGIFFGSGIYVNESGRNTAVSPLITSDYETKGIYCASGSTAEISGSIMYYLD